MVATTILIFLVYSKWEESGNGSKTDTEWTKGKLSSLVMSVCYCRSLNSHRSIG